MNRVRKIGDWIWRNKERMVLVVMVCFLGFRVYQVVNPADPDRKIMPRPPRSEITDTAQLPGTPGPPPPPPPAEDYSLIWRINPFGGWQSTGTTGRGPDTDGQEDLQIRLLRIREVTPGEIRAQIETGGRTQRWYEEGEAFESFELLTIDVEAESVVVFSERLERPIILTVEE